MKQVAEFYPSVTSLVQAVCSDRREKPLGQNERAGTQDKTKSVNLAIDWNWMKPDKEERSVRSWNDPYFWKQVWLQHEQTDVIANNASSISMENSWAWWLLLNLKMKWQNTSVMRNEQKNSATLKNDI